MDAIRNRLRWPFIIGVTLFSWHATPTCAYAQNAAPADMFTHIVSSAGIFFGPLLLLVSVCLVTMFALLVFDLRLGSATPPAFVQAFTDAVARQQYQQAYALCRADPSSLGRVLTAGMGRLQYGIEDARQAASNTLESVRAGKEQLINYLGTIGTIGPMIGLVGTVFGMIQSFMELSKGGTPKSEELASGISHALVVTLLGVGISVPAIFFYSFFRNRLVRICLEVGNLADDLLTQVFHQANELEKDSERELTASAKPHAVA